MSERLVELSDSEADLDRFSATYSPRLIVAQVNTSSEEEEGMDLKQRSSLKGLLANRNKGSTTKEVTKTPVPPLLTTEGLLPYPDLKKKRKAQEREEGEIIPPKGVKQPKNVKDKWAPFVESKRKLVLKCAEGQAYGPFG